MKSALWVSVQFKTLSLILCSLFYAPCTEKNIKLLLHLTKHEPNTRCVCLSMLSISEFHTLADKVTQTLHLFELVILN